MVDARHGKQLFGIMPQLSKILSSLFEFASTEEISSRNTGSFTSIIFPSTPTFWTSELLAASEIFGFCDWLASLECGKLDTDPPSIPFRDTTSADINCILTI